MFIASDEQLVIAIKEEDGQIGQEEIGRTELLSLGNELRQTNRTNHIVALRRDVLLVNLLEVKHVLNIGLRIAHIDLQQDVGRVVGLLLEVLLLVLVTVVVLTSHYIAQNYCESDRDQQLYEWE